MSKENLLEDLNPQQRSALLHTEGPLLILAGAGSGKTRVITYKFAYLAKSNRLSPSSILTVTFTNKAANEMKERIVNLIGRDIQGSWIGTFHSQCNKILRKEINALGYRTDFSIYDEGDQCNLVRYILKEFKLYEALYKGVASRISSLKSSLIGPEEFLSTGDGFGFDEKLAKVYIRYQDELKRCNALDFDDLIMLTVKLFEENPKVLYRYQNVFPHILVDEFQDTNYAQYKLLRLLASAHRNICVVGDDDQSIYKFRGADVNNILNFEKDFSGAKVIKLEQNYRSTQNILDVSGAIISMNPIRKLKKLWTERGCGEKVFHCWMNTEDEEAKHIAKVIRELYLKGAYNYRDFAVLYRVNLQSRAIEEALRDEGLPYHVIGGISFYQRKEIKDIIAYMRLAINQDDSVSLRRVINCPPRGMGAATLSKIEHEAKKKSVSLFTAIKSTLKVNGIASAAREHLGEFIKLIEHISSVNYKSAADMLRYIVDKTGYMDSIDEERGQNINELIASAAGKDIKDFIDRVSLFTNIDDAIAENAISLMTLHSAKGLEFPVVFIVGLEEGVLPYFKAIENTDEIPEERRLFYVGMTRAKDILWLTGARKRRLYAKVQEQEPSRFLNDIPRQYCQWIEKTVKKPLPVAISIKKMIEPLKPPTPYAAGCRVKHPKWGVGVVRDCYGDGDEQKVMVNFPNVGVKRLALKFANLEKI